MGGCVSWNLKATTICDLRETAMNSREDNKGFQVISNSPAETIRLGERIGDLLRGGEVIGLVGPLGSGKTHLIKGIVTGLGATDMGEINSPTFVLVNEYSGEEMHFDVYHIDAYRLGSVEEFEMLGFDDLCYRSSVVLIEWADKIESALQGTEYIQIKLSHIDESHRRIHIDKAPKYFSGMLD